MEPVTVEGIGPAACSSILALRHKGIPVRVILRKEAPAVSSLVLEEVAVRMLTDLCDSSSLFDAGHQLRRRAVCWGSDDVQMLPQPAISIAGGVLRARLRQQAFRRLDASCDVETDQGDAPSGRRARGEWHIKTSRDHPIAGSTLHRHGNRITLSVEVALARGADPATYWVEAQDAGWLLLAPTSDRTALLQATLPKAPPDPAEALAGMLDRSRCVSRRLGEVDVGTLQMAASAPGLCSPSSGVGWLAAGAAGMSLDPLCGDGTAQAFRGGLLAAGVAGAALAGGDPRALARHFDDRVRMAFAAHLNACAQFYSRRIFDSTWTTEIERTLRGVAEFDAAPPKRLRFSFRDLGLVSDELEGQSQSP